MKATRLRYSCLLVTEQLYKRPFLSVCPKLVSHIFKRGSATPARFGLVQRIIDWTRWFPIIIEDLCVCCKTYTVSQQLLGRVIVIYISEKCSLHNVTFWKLHTFTFAYPRIVLYDLCFKISLYNIKCKKQLSAHPGETSEEQTLFFFEMEEISHCGPFIFVTLNLEGD